jgi:hypothetical protein
MEIKMKNKLLQIGAELQQWSGKRSAYHNNQERGTLVLAVARSQKELRDMWASSKKTVYIQVGNDLVPEEDTSDCPVLPKKMMAVGVFDPFDGSNSQNIKISRVEPVKNKQESVNVVWTEIQADDIGTISIAGSPWVIGFVPAADKVNFIGFSNEGLTQPHPIAPTIEIQASGAYRVCRPTAPPINTAKP